jgi:hypothetical protein
MVNARDSTHLIPDLRFAPGIKWEVPGGEYVDEPVLYWLQRGSGVELSANPPTIGFANSEIEDTAIVSVATFAAGVFENFATSCLNSFAGALTNSGTSVLLNLADAPTIGTRALGNWECTFTNSETGALANLGGAFFEATPRHLRAMTARNSNVVVLPPRDPWLVATWDLIADHRNLTSGWDGETAAAPRRESLDTAEALAVLIAAKPMQTRPQFSVDCNGLPGFAMYDDRLYLHLTIDDVDRLSWYAVSGGTESFADDIAFDGAQLPPLLDRLL